ncbi:MAG: hypothetical protein CRU78_08050 [Candidatus Accumulibacter phosphatis]|uniref:Uncharacterized protein n=1 Tax=Candidatus Accumulibacter phosphatis TaxID=327160 RepID=A0A6A7RTQ4_9PROT|nr:hypothetical protein [Candidatus Accumulibacter phosphatis]
MLNSKHVYDAASKWIAAMIATLGCPPCWSSGATIAGKADGDEAMARKHRRASMTAGKAHVEGRQQVGGRSLILGNRGLPARFWRWLA